MALDKFTGGPRSFLYSQSYIEVAPAVIHFLMQTSEVLKTSEVFLFTYYPLLITSSLYTQTDSKHFDCCASLWKLSRAVR